MPTALTGQLTRVYVPLEATVVVDRTFPVTGSTRFAYRVLPALVPTSLLVWIFVKVPLALPSASSHTVPDTVIQVRVRVWVVSSVIPQAQVFNRRALPKSLH